tara:strand:+ start:1705 stop:2397 length:693 start_codon:yes stop_codon:yes gene_type:complete
MKIYSLTCTRDENLSKTTTNLLEYFESCGIHTKTLINRNSIFEAYDKGLDEIDAGLDDIIILCHDDIEILTRPDVFTQVLREKLSKSDTGFVGLAGAKNFGETAIWWNKQEWMAGHLSGYVYHGTDNISMYPTYFGNLGDVVVLDGVFLAATKRTLRSIQLTQPKGFEGKWDFYDIFYTFQTFRKGLKNYTLPLQVRHESGGEITGRDSWHKNREAFISIFGKYLPASVS